MKNLNLLIPSQNNYNQTGDSKDKFVINPSANSSFHMQLFEFFGLLMGCCIRTGVHLILDLTQTFWKQIVNEKVELADIKEFDLKLVEQEIHFKQIDEYTFQNDLFETWSTILSDNSKFELKKNGDTIPVTYKERFVYYESILKTRLEEGASQISAMKRGITKIIPKDL